MYNLISSIMKKSNLYLALSLVVSMMFCACTPVPEGEAINNVWVYNNTPDTLTMRTPKFSYVRDTETFVLPPYDTTFVFAWGTYDVGYESYWAWMSTRDTSKLSPVWFYKNGTEIIRWNPPCREMGDTNCWYNKNSWNTVRQGRDNRYVRSTFTITEADYGHFF